MLLVGNHSGGNLTPGHARLHARVQHLLRRRAALLPARPQPRAGDARPRHAAQVRHRRGHARERAARRSTRAPRCSSTRAATTRCTGRSWESAQGRLRRAQGLHPARARAKGVPIVPVVSIGGQETALFLSRGERLAKLLAARPHVPPEGAADLAGAAVGPERRRHARPHPAARRRSRSRCSSRSTCGVATTGRRQGLRARASSEMQTRAHRARRRAPLPVIG